MNKPALLTSVALFVAFACNAFAGDIVPPVPNGRASGASLQQNAERPSTTDYCDRNLGKWFYCEEPAQPDEPEPAKPDAKPMTQDEADAAEEAKFKADMEKARLIAVWNPTEQNLRRYYAYQKMTLDKAGLFADNWRRMIWEDPSMDYNLVRPVSDLGKSDWRDTRNADRDLFFRSIADKVGIYFIFKGGCAPCRTQSPIMVNFYQRYGVSVHAISADGAKNEYFPDAKPDRGQLAAWNITNPITPAYLIYQKSDLGADGQVHQLSVTVTDGRVIHVRPCTNPRGCLTYLGAGILNMDDLADRLFVLLGTEAGKDF